MLADLKTDSLKDVLLRVTASEKRKCHESVLVSFCGTRRNTSYVSRTMVTLVTLLFQAVIACCLGVEAVGHGSSAHMRCTITTTDMDSDMYV